MFDKINKEISRMKEIVCVYSIVNSSKKKVNKARLFCAVRYKISDESQLR